MFSLFHQQNHLEILIALVHWSRYCCCRWLAPWHAGGPTVHLCYLCAIYLMTNKAKSPKLSCLVDLLLYVVLDIRHRILLLLYQSPVNMTDKTRGLDGVTQKDRNQCRSVNDHWTWWPVQPHWHDGRKNPEVVRTAPKEKRNPQKTRVFTISVKLFSNNSKISNINLTWH